MKLALKNGLLTRQQIHGLIQKSRSTGRGVAELALSDGVLADDQVDRIQRALIGSRVARIDQMYGRVVQSRGLVPTNYIARAFEIQKQRNYEVRLGELLVSANLLSMEAHAMILKEVLSRLGQEGAGGPPATPLPPPPPVQASPTSSRSGRLGSRPPLSSGRRRIGGRPSGATRAQPTSATRAQPVLELKGDSVKKLSLDQVPKTPATVDKPGFERETRLDEGYQPLGLGATKADSLLIEHSKKDRYTSERGQQFLASAMEIELDDEDEEAALTAHDRALLENDVKIVEDMSRSGMTTFGKLDDIAFSATKVEGAAAGFKADEYFRKRRRRNLSKQILYATGGGILLALLLVMVMAWSNSSSFADLKTRATEARAKTDPTAAYNDFTAINRDLKSLGSLGVQDKAAKEFERFLSAMILQSQIRSLIALGKEDKALTVLEESRAERAAELEKGVSEDALGLTLSLFEEMNNEIEFAKAWRIGANAESLERYGLALRSFRQAQLLASFEDNRAERKIQAIQETLRSQLVTYRARVKSGEPRAKAALKKAVKRYFQLFYTIPEEGDITEDRDPKRDLGELGNTHIATGSYEDALEVLLEAKAVGAGVKVDHQISLVRQKIKTNRWWVEGERLLAKKKFRKACSLLLRARSNLHDPEEILKIDQLIGLCKKALE
ncbi:MAG: hypothetical protein P1V97_33625 [Planctomycetota bacterium]|nr:hypothetical protein [Planctomycetota bacterium]